VLTTTIEGRRRFPVRVRYAPQYRSDPEALGRVLVAASNGAPVPSISTSLSGNPDSNLRKWLNERGLTYVVGEPHARVTESVARMRRRASPSTA